jgi:hypothetical protein
MLHAMTVDGLVTRAGREAEELGHGWIGLDHFVLALLRPGDESAAARALRACGLTHPAYAAEVGRLPGGAGPGAERHGRSLNPRAQRMLGRAEGIAAGLAAPRPAPEHVLLAILWDADGTPAHLLQRLGLTRDDVLGRLREAGATVPAADLPASRQPRWGERFPVPGEHLPALRAELRHLLPPGTTFGFNQDASGAAWLVATEGVDLAVYVPVALAAWERGRLPCPCCRCVALDRHRPRAERRCDVCWWPADLDPLGDGARLAEARRSWSRCGACDERFRDRVRPPAPDEVPPWRAAGGA